LLLLLLLLRVDRVCLFATVSSRQTQNPPLNTMNKMSFSSAAPSAKKGNQANVINMMLIAKGIAPVLPPQKGPSRPKEGGSPSPVNDWDFVPTYSGYGSFEPQNPPYFEL
jgi:hypothetical protein